MNQRKFIPTTAAVAIGSTLGFCAAAAKAPVLVDGVVLAFGK